MGQLSAAVIKLDKDYTILDRNHTILDRNHKAYIKQYTELHTYATNLRTAYVDTAKQARTYYRTWQAMEEFLPPAYGTREPSAPCAIPADYGAVP